MSIIHFCRRKYFVGVRRRCKERSLVCRQNIENKKQVLPAKNAKKHLFLENNDIINSKNWKI